MPRKDRLDDLALILSKVVQVEHELFLRVWALQAILRRRGLVADAEVEALMEQFRKNADERAQGEQATKANTNERSNEELLRLLEEFEGPKQ